MHAMKKKKRSFLARVLSAAIAGIGLALGLTFPADSLTFNEAEKVTALLVELAPDLGPFAYDQDEADRWFDEDAAAEGKIAAAGFTRESWRTALGETFRGYLATIPNDVFAEKLAEPMKRLENASGVSEHQKAEIRAWAEEQIAETQLLRAEGDAYVETVRSLAATLDAVFGTEDLDQNP
jgi:hypothetical protein